MQAMRVATMLVGLLVSLSGWAQEQEYVPVRITAVTPNPATAGQPITVYLGEGEDCGHPNRETIQVEVVGHTINIASEAFAGCIMLPPLPPLSVEIGQFPPGEYTVAYQATVPLWLPATTQYASFVVLADSRPEPIPAFSWPGVLMMLLLISLVAGWRMNGKASG